MPRSTAIRAPLRVLETALRTRSCVVPRSQRANRLRAHRSVRPTLTRATATLVSFPWCNEKLMPKGHRVWVTATQSQDPRHGHPRPGLRLPFPRRRPEPRTFPGPLKPRPAGLGGLETLRRASSSSPEQMRNGSEGPPSWNSWAQLRVGAKHVSARHQRPRAGGSAAGLGRRPATPQRMPFGPHQCGKGGRGRQPAAEGRRP